MISVGPIVVALIIVSQLLQQASRGRKRRSAPGQSEIVWVVLAWTALPMIAILFLGLAAEGRVWALLPFAALVVTLFPWPTARRVAIPLGLPRTSYYVTLLSGLTWRRDRSGGALLAATLAALHRRRSGARVLAFLESRLTRCKPLRGAAVAALGFMALCRDDRVAARRLLASALEMDRRIVPAAARRMAKEWLAADAAALVQFHRSLFAMAFPWNDGDHEALNVCWSAIERVTTASGERPALTPRVRVATLPDTSRQRWQGMPLPDCGARGMYRANRPQYHSCV